MGKTALLIVDMQYGFMPGGELPVEEGDKIVESIVQAAENVDYILATQDWHPQNHCSFSDEPDYKDKWPIHCVQGTHSAEIHPGILALDPVVFQKADQVDQDSYSGFGNKDLEKWLKGHDVTKVLVVGLATDYCVYHTAMDAQAKGFQTAILLESVRGVAPETTKSALEKLAAAGVKLRVEDE